MQRLELKGFPAINFLSNYTNEESKLKGHAMNVSFKHCGYSIEYYYIPDVQIEIKYDEDSKQNYIEVNIVRDSIEDGVPIVYKDGIYELNLTFQDDTSKILIDIHIEDLDINKTKKIYIENNEMRINFNTRNITILYYTNDYNKEEPSLIKRKPKGIILLYKGMVNIKIFKRLFCKHEWVRIDNVYGDMKNVFSGYYKCKKCGKEELR